MQIDVARHIGAVTREVGRRERDGRDARAVVASRTYETTVEDLCDAITNAERLPRWFLPVTGDLRPGGRYQLKGNAGGSITRCEPPRHLAVTWEYGGGVSWLEVRLSEEEGGGARLELEHVAPVDEHWEQFGPGAAGVGWDLALMGLAQHVATGASNDPRAAEAWMISEEGRDFIHRSSAQWGDASAAAGTEPAAAEAAARRTAAFYTGDAGAG